MPVRKCPSSPQRPLKQYFKASVKWHAMPQVRLLPLALTPATTARIQENVVYSLPHIFSTFTSLHLSCSPPYGKAVFWCSNLRDTSRPTPKSARSLSGSGGVGGRGRGKEGSNTKIQIHVFMLTQESSCARTSVNLYVPAEKLQHDKITHTKESAVYFPAHVPERSKLSVWDNHR